MSRIPPTSSLYSVMVVCLFLQRFFFFGSHVVVTPNASVPRLHDDNFDSVIR